MGFLTKLTAVAIMAVIAGVYTAGALRDGGYQLIERQIGQWRTWPAAGTPSADPYTRGHFIASKRLPLSRFEAIELEARIGSADQRLNSSCSYKIVGQMPPVRRWSLSSYNADDTENTLQGSNSTLSSSQATIRPGGFLELTLSAQPHSGNWLRPNGSGDQVLVLRLVNPTYSAGRDTIATAPLKIQRLSCL